MTAFGVASLIAWLVVVIAAGLARGRLYATFSGVLLGVHSLLAVAVAPLLARAAPVLLVPSLGLPAPLLFLHAAAYLHFFLLARPRMRPLVFRALVSVPASYFVAGTFLALPWALLAAFGFSPGLILVPYALALVGLVQSLRAPKSEIDLAVDDGYVEAQRGPRPHRSGPLRVERPLRVVQISDPHLGPFMSVERLAAICARAVERRPDLIVLTGDFLTI